MFPLCAEVLATVTQPDFPPQIFRLYHDQSGRPLHYSMEDLPGLYIDVTIEQYHRASFRVRVRDGELVAMPDPRPPRLKPASTGQSCHRYDVTVIVPQGTGNYWNLDHETY